MADFNWDELPASVDIDKKPKRDTLTADQIPAGIQKLAQTAVTSGKFHYQPLPHKDLVEDFMKFIRSAGDFTEPTSTVLAKLVTEYPDPANPGKTKKVTRGVMVRYSAGLRRGRKTDEAETEGTETEGTETEGTESTEGTETA